MTDADIPGGFLSNEEVQLIIFGGKGGCGKTTAAAATAVHLAGRRPRQKILVVSTDPAHSLADSLDQPIGDEVRPVTGFSNLWAVEFNAEGLMEDFKETHGEVIRTLADRGTFLDEEDVNGILGLPLPGLDEVMAILEIARILRSKEFDLIIQDTAPTGHTLRMLEMPRQMEDWIRVFHLMQAKHRYLKEHYTGRYVKDDADKLLDLIKKDVQGMRELLRDPRRTEFVPVAIPEPMSIDETKRLVGSLQRDRLPVRSIVVNQLPPPGQCHLCRARWEAAALHLESLREAFVPYHLIEVPLFPQEVRGIGPLRSFADCLSGLPVLGQPASAHLTEAETDSPDPGQLGELLERDLEFILIGGKGGVGKTSLAAAMALLIARRDPEKRVLLFSTDPAHSLSDVFASPIGDRITRIASPGRLDALEIDAEKLLKTTREELERDLWGVLRMSFWGNVQFDREVMEELGTLFPPGLDEIMALRQIMKVREEGAYDVFIVDTAATGHLLRLLELPEIILGWVKGVLRLLLKYRRLVGLGEAADGLLELSRDVRRIREVLTDPEKTEMVAVTIPEAMGVLETKRLLSSLARLKVPCRHVVVNMVIPPSNCPFCAAKREGQRPYLHEIGQMTEEGYLITEVPLFPRPIQGVEALSKLLNALYGLATASGNAPQAVPSGRERGCRERQ